VDSPERDGCGVVDAAGFAALDEAGRRRVLVALSARFARAFPRWMDSHACDGLSYPRLGVIETLATRGPTMMRDLAAHLDLSARNMTAVVDSLEEGGLVLRRPHPTDRRATLVELTPDGATSAVSALGPVFDAMGRVFDGFTRAEEDALHAALARLLGTIRAGCDRPPTADPVV